MTRPGEESARRPKLYSGTACDQCFRRKVRCAADRPTCSRCRRNNGSCTYSTGKSARKPKRNSNSISRSPEPVQSSPPSPTSSCGHLGTSIEEAAGSLPMSAAQAVDRHLPVKTLPVCSNCAHEISAMLTYHRLNVKGLIPVLLLEVTWLTRWVILMQHRMATYPRPRAT